MDWPNFASTIFRPSRALGLLLLAELTGFLVFVGWEYCWYERTLFGHTPPDLSGQTWVTLVGGTAAMSGWIVTSIITVRNSIKQHTINTLLQSRLSATYDGYAKDINRKFATHQGELIPLTYGDLENKRKRPHMNTVRYILNYLEFIAIGVRKGDFDEKMLKRSLRSIVNSVQRVSEVYVNHRQATNPHVFENFVWLHNRWNKK